MGLSQPIMKYKCFEFIHVKPGDNSLGHVGGVEDFDGPRTVNSFFSLPRIATTSNFDRLPFHHLNCVEFAQAQHVLNVMRTTQNEYVMRNSSPALRGPSQNADPELHVLMCTRQHG